MKSDRLDRGESKVSSGGSLLHAVDAGCNLFFGYFLPASAIDRRRLNMASMPRFLYCVCFQEGHNTRVLLVFPASVKQTNLPTTFVFLCN